MAISFLKTVRDVPLCQVGEDWPASTGPVTFTPEDFQAAVQALDDPFVRKPVVKLGHTDPNFDGYPAIGRIENIHVSDDGSTLLGDLVGLPAWFVDVDDDGNSVMASAYPDRSIEGYFGYKTQSKTHQFVLTGVALLGVSPPAITTLEGIAELYGTSPANVAAAATVREHGAPVRVEALREDGNMKLFRKKAVAASTSVEDIRRTFYELAPWSYWIQQVLVDPPQLIVEDDDEGVLYRIPYTITNDEVTYGDEVRVRIVYEDIPDGVAASAERATPPLATYATREASRHGMVRADSKPEEGNVDGAALRRMLGLAADATDEQVDTALAEQAPEVDDEPDPAAPVPPVAPVPPAEEPTVDPGTAAPTEGAVLVDAKAWETTQRNAQAGAAAAKALAVSERDQLLTSAVADGKFERARIAHWQAAYDADPEGAKATIAKLTKGLIPVEEQGHGDDAGKNGEGVAATAYNSNWLTPAERANLAHAHQEA